MRPYREVLKAGVTTAINIQGLAFFIVRCDAGAVLQVEFLRRQKENGKVQYVGKGLQVRPVGGFEGLKITSPVDATVDFVITDGGFDLAFNEDASTIGNGDANAIPVRVPAGQRLPVDIGGGAINVTADNVGVSNSDVNAVPVRNQALATFAHPAPVVVGLAATSLGAADATRRKLIFRNDHPSAKVGLGGAGVTLENAAIVLLPGDIWKEEDAAGAAWFAVSDTAATMVQMMELK